MNRILLTTMPKYDDGTEYLSYYASLISKRAKKLKEEWGKTKDKLEAEMSILENENKLQQKKLKEAGKKLSNSNLKPSKKEETDQSVIENNAAITIAVKMLLGLVAKKDLKVSDKNLTELKKLKKRLETIF